MKKGQNFNSDLVIRVWREMLEAYEMASPPPYPSVRTVADRLAEMGYRTYKNVPPSRETVRVAMKSSEEGQELLRQAHARYRKGGEYADSS